MAKLVWIAALAALCATAARAEDQGPPYHALGIGALKCSNWIADHAGDHPTVASIGDDSWLTGYLTAYNAWKAPDGNISSTTNLERMRVWMNAWCAQNQDRSIADAAERLMVSLTLRKTTPPAAPTAP